MNRNIIVGNYQQLTGRMMQTWGRLIQDPFCIMEGRRKEHFGNMREMYGRFESKHNHSALGNVTRHFPSA
jgi:uncharacterized protein YjbJ (UPF0337 family)